MSIRHIAWSPWTWMVVVILAAAIVYAPGLSGYWLFDDYPNIVDNRGVQPSEVSIPTLVTAAMSSPSSQLKRPLASLSFALDYIIEDGLSPGGMRTTNLVFHLLNGFALFLLARLLFAGARGEVKPEHGRMAAVLAFLWMVLPINVTAVLYIVQRMESMANLAVLLGLYGYAAARRRMLSGRPGLLGAALSITFGTVVGALAKETAVLLPIYAFALECLIFRFRRKDDDICRSIVALYALCLALPLLVGFSIFVPTLLADATWAPRPFTIRERLLSECRIVVLYLRWTLLPTTHSLSFYHDDFVTSKGWLSPWSTLVSAIALLALGVAGWLTRKSRPLVALGIAWFFICHALTATIIPLELIYEHRNYFSSLGVILAAFALIRSSPFRMANALLVIMAGWWVVLTGLSAYAWGGDPLRLPAELARRNQASARAQYELGRTYVIASEYRPDSPFVPAARRALLVAAATPGASILPEQALIFLYARTGGAIDPAWWKSMENKLASHPVGIEDESALIALTNCLMNGSCEFSSQSLLDAYLAALNHPNPRARLVAAYGDFAWQILDDHKLGYAMALRATTIEPREPAYRQTAVRLAMAMHDTAEARLQLTALERLNVGGSLSASIASLHALMDTPAKAGSQQKLQR